MLFKWRQDRTKWNCLHNCIDHIDMDLRSCGLSWGVEVDLKTLACHSFQRDTEFWMVYSNPLSLKHCQVHYRVCTALGNVQTLELSSLSKVNALNHKTKWSKFSFRISTELQLHNLDHCQDWQHCSSKNVNHPHQPKSYHTSLNNRSQFVS